jgi:hypothetical protein
MDKPKQERRNEARHRALKGARIVFKRHDALIDCTVSNLSDRGARLKVESPIGIPNSFDLVLDHDLYATRAGLLGSFRGVLGGTFRALKR